MIIFRYLAKEIFLTLLALTAILLLIFLSNQFVQYLNRAASGSIPGVIIFKLMLLEIPSLMVFLLPLGFYVTLLLVYGRMYAENEMTVLRASGYGPNQLLKHSFIMATVVAVVVAVVILWGSPLIFIERAKLLRAAGIKTLIQTIMPGRFHHFGNKVFFVQKMSRDHKEAEGIFLAQQNFQKGDNFWDLMWAKQAFLQSDLKKADDYIVLKDGQVYQGKIGQADYQIARFEEYKARLPQPTTLIDGDIRTLSTLDLLPWNNPDPKKAAEMQWRLSIPLMVLTLTLIAVPLSRVNPRTGKFAKLLPAIIIFIFYANGMFLARDALNSAKVPIWLGMWWLHGLAVILGLLLVWRSRHKLS